ncbi:MULTISPECIES: hypothetical protein [Pseudomonas]|uniref:hypothetical protein n=1 Tax=Pseudomonas TaxID=286 RepID=UPI0029132E89|nr:MULTISPECIES: hypothetical protein [Pseudomonas]MDU8545708.1 hypothetical protein [Pseudomonas syringae group sp. J248-6]WPP02635.1 hypothetical protein SFA35_26410 [Pseudomonas sp. HR96]
MSDREQQSDFLNVLIWLETASEEQIQGALHLATGQVRTDIENGIKALMAADRPVLARIFTDLVPHAVSLEQIGESHHGLRCALREVAHNTLASNVDQQGTPVGYWRAVRELRKLYETGQVTPPQYQLLTDELHTRVNVTKEVALWAS